MTTARVRALLGEWLPALVLMSVIFWFSSQSHLPGPSEKSQDFLLKKLAHVLAYAALALCYLRGVHLARRPFLLAFLLAAAFAATDEFHQSVVPLREATLRDVVIDSMAGALALRGVRHLLGGKRRSVWQDVARAVTGLPGDGETGGKTPSPLGRRSG